jgi:hypothetical protein
VGPGRSHSLLRNLTSNFSLYFLRSDAPMISYKATNCYFLFRGPLSASGPALRRSKATLELQTLKSHFLSLTCLSSRRLCLHPLALGLSLDPSTRSPRRLLGRASRLEEYPSFCIQALETYRTRLTAHVLTLSKMILAPWTRSI